MQNKQQPNYAVYGLSKSQKMIACSIVCTAVLYYLWGWHKDHVVQYWPFAVFLLCPLMHLFMHHGHGGHSQPETQPNREGGGN